MNTKKLFLLDTNILMYDPEAMFSFAHQHVGISIIVLEELDHLKVENSERGAAAREVTRHLDALRQKGSLKDGVSLDNGSTFQVFFMREECNQEYLSLHSGLERSPDNQMLMTAAALSKQGYEVHFVSKDLNARVKADVLGIKTTDYLKGRVSSDQVYRGWRLIMVPSVELKRTMPHALSTLAQEHNLTINEFIQLQSSNSELHYRIFRYLGDDRFKEVLPPTVRWPLEPRNAQQLMALDLLFDPSVQLVNLVGPAGTGKTFVALWAGLYQVLIQNTYGKMLISRPVIPLGPDIGYLPGTIQEKLHSWMQPIYDTMEFISHAVNNARRSVSNHEEQSRQPKQYPSKKHKFSDYNYSHEEHKRRLMRNAQDRSPLSREFLGSLDQLINEGKVSLEAITYMRGRSIPFQYILIDESQNLTPHEVKTLISRVGQGSKIILLGDPYQIDAFYLDFNSNGLIVSGSKFKNQSIFGTVFLHSSERSELSKLVNELM